MTPHECRYSQEGKTLAHSGSLPGSATAAGWVAGFAASTHSRQQSDEAVVSRLFARWQDLVTTGGPDAPDSQPQMGELVFWNAASGRKKRICHSPRACAEPSFRRMASSSPPPILPARPSCWIPATGKTRATLTPHSKPGECGGDFRGQHVNCRRQF